MSLRGILRNHGDSMRDEEDLRVNIQRVEVPIVIYPPQAPILTLETCRQRRIQMMLRKAEKVPFPDEPIHTWGREDTDHYNYLISLEEQILPAPIRGDYLTMEQSILESTLTALQNAEHLKQEKQEQLKLKHTVDWKRKQAVLEQAQERLPPIVSDLGKNPIGPIKILKMSETLSENNYKNGILEDWNHSNNLDSRSEYSKTRNIGIETHPKTILVERSLGTPGRELRWHHEVTQKEYTGTKGNLKGIYRKAMAIYQFMIKTGTWAFPFDPDIDFWEKIQQWMKDKTGTDPWKSLDRNPKLLNEKLQLLLKLDNFREFIIRIKKRTYQFSISKMFSDKSWCRRIPESIKLELMNIAYTLGYNLDQDQAQQLIKIPTLWGDAYLKRSTEDEHDMTIFITPKDTSRISLDIVKTSMEDGVLQIDVTGVLQQEVDWPAFLAFVLEKIGYLETQPMRFTDQLYQKKVVLDKDKLLNWIQEQGLDPTVAMNYFRNFEDKYPVVEIRGPPEELTSVEGYRILSSWKRIQQFLYWKLKSGQLMKGDLDYILSSTSYMRKTIKEIVRSQDPMIKEQLKLTRETYLNEEVVNEEIILDIQNIAKKYQVWI